MKIYISGGITGEEYYKEKFEKAYNMLKEKYPEADIVNPARLSEIFPNGTHSDYVQIDLLMLQKCDRICQLDGWERSTGACIEYGYAYANDIKVIR